MKTAQSPTREEVKAARLAAGITQTEAAELIGYGLRWWQQVEAGKATFHPSLWRDWKNQVKKHKTAGVVAEKQNERKCDCGCQG